MPIPDADLVQDEIEKLSDLKSKVQHYSAFGNDNQAAIQIQIDVLEGEIEDEDELYALKEDGDITDHEVDSAVEALDWLDGEGDLDTLSEGWETLVA